MDTAWKPISTLPLGHYAVGLLDDGQQADIYRAAPGQLLDAASGVVLARVRCWRPREVDSASRVAACSANS
jgi:hypothetical protein